VRLTFKAKKPTASRKDAKKREERKEHQKHLPEGFSLRTLRFFASLREMLFCFSPSMPSALQ
jgi:hypothetical protein